MLQNKNLIVDLFIRKNWKITMPPMGEI